MISAALKGLLCLTARSPSGPTKTETKILRKVHGQALQIQASVYVFVSSRSPAFDSLRDAM
jgi:hypothetical protein